MDQPLPPPPGATLRPKSSPGPALSSGFARAIGFVAGLFVLGVVFFAGLLFGMLTMFAGTMDDPAILRETYRDGGRDTIAVLPVIGVIDGFQSERFRLFTDTVIADSSVKGVILRVDSPGGGVSASDQIWYQVRRMRNAGLPVVASYGGVAASGGYYISCATDHIVAEPTCITGSIGVIAQAFIFKGLMDKIGVEPVTLLSTDSPAKDMGNPWRPWTEQDYDRYTEMLDAAYSIFNERVRDGRKAVITDPARIDELADGSIFTEDEAKTVGLVDSVGYLDDAVATVETIAGLAPGGPTVLVLHEPMPLFGNFLAGVKTPAPLGDLERARSWFSDLGSPRLMYLMR